MKERPRNAEKRALWAAQERFRRRRISRTSAASQPRQRQPYGTSPLTPRLAKPRAKRTWIIRSVVIAVVLVAVSAGTFGYKILAASESISDAERSILGQLKDLLFQSGNTLAGEKDNRINVLLIAVGGSGHQGENLADTIMLASLRPQDNTAALLSIPRDLYVQVPGEEYYSKINAVHAYGESQQAGNGPRLLASLVEEITGQPVHYYVRVDFTAFKSIVDAVGGINVTIDNSFYDFWHKISFPAGTEKMNGERALAYVRARYIEGPEGGDFRRAARQQQVLLALREKVFSVQTAFDFTRANAILNSLSDNIRTDMQLWEMKRFYELGRLINPDKVHSVILSSDSKGVLTGGTEILGGVPASVLRPRTGDYSEIQQIAKDVFGTTPLADTAEPAAAIQAVPVPSPSPSPTPEEKPSLEIRNGTNIAGLAGRTADRLQTEGYAITGVGNAATRNHPTSEVYTVAGKYDGQATVIAGTFGVQAKNGLPEDEAASSADIVIILGTDADDGNG